MVRSRSGGGSLVVEVPRSLIPLLESSGVHDLVPSDGPLPKFDLQVSMLSLPDVFQTTLDTIPHDVPYLFAEPRRLAQWRERLCDLDGLQRRHSLARQRRLSGRPPPFGALIAVCSVG